MSLSITTVYVTLVTLKLGLVVGRGVAVVSNAIHHSYRKKHQNTVKLLVNFLSPPADKIHSINTFNHTQLIQN